MDTVTQIIKSIRQFKLIAIICHTNPDPDTVCSALALSSALYDIGIVSHIYCDTVPSGKVALIEGIELINKDYKPSYPLCICVDCSDIKRLGEAVEVFNSAKIKINIDHHKTNTLYADINYIEEDASSTAEILYHILITLCEGKMTKLSAKLLYTGMVADSGAFTFPSTTHKTMATAGELMKYGFDASAICYDMIKKTPIRVFNMKLIALRDVEFYDNNSIGVIRFNNEIFDLTSTTIEDTSGIINEIINVDTIKVAMAITETDREVFKISIRSKGNIDVAAVALSFGGGGHKNASGCELHGEYDDIILRLLSAIREELCRG